MNRQEILASYSLKYEGDWTRIAEAVRNHEKPGSVPQASYFTIYDEIYPQTLKELRFPPWVIYYQGDTSLLKKDGITVVGSRNPDDYGIQVTRDITTRLCLDYVMISGLAKGVDALVHHTAIRCGGKTIGVIGSSLSVQYPKENQDLYRAMRDHLILSEYPPDTGVRKKHFPWRNRILAALGKAVIVTQAACKSGTMHTVNEAINLSKDVYCVPHPFMSEAGEGCNKLISQGAMILYGFAQLEDLGSCQRI